MNLPSKCQQQNCQVVTVVLLYKNIVEAHVYLLGGLHHWCLSQRDPPHLHKKNNCWLFNAVFPLNGGVETSWVPQQQKKSSETRLSFCSPILTWRHCGKDLKAAAWNVSSVVLAVGQLGSNIHKSEKSKSGNFRVQIWWWLEKFPCPSLMMTRLRL